MLLELARFLMINCLLVGQSKIEDLLDVQIGLHLLVLMKLTTLLHTEKSSCHELILDISMEIFILGVSTFHWALKGLHLLPFADTISTKCGLARGALLGVEQNLEADGTFEVSLILLQNSYRLNTLVIFENFLWLDQGSGRKFLSVYFINRLLRLRVALRGHVLWPIEGRPDVSGEPLDQSEHLLYISSLHIYLL